MLITTTRGNRLFGIIFLVSGLAVLAWTFNTFMMTRSILSHGTTVVGTVTEMKRHVGRRGSSTYSPVITFVTPNGPSTFTDSMSSSSPSYTVGQSVNVIFETADPSHARINTPFGLWGSTVLPGFIGIVFTLVGGYQLFLRKADEVSAPTVPQNQPLK